MFNERCSCALNVVHLAIGRKIWTPAQNRTAGLRSALSSQHQEGDKDQSWLAPEGDVQDVIRDNQALSRFELEHEGYIALSAYRRAPGVITFIHTEVPNELTGKGVGSALVKGALDAVRAQGLRVIAQCPFVAAYIAKHKDYADLLNRSSEPGG